MICMEMAAASLPPLGAVLVLVHVLARFEFVFDQAVVDLFTGQTRGLEGARIIDEWGSSRHDLARAPRRKHHVGKLALWSFRLHGHLSLSPRMMPEVPPLDAGGGHCCSERPSKSLPPRLRLFPRRSSSRSSHNTCRTPRFQPAHGPGGGRFPRRNPARGRAGGAPALPWKAA